MKMLTTKDAALALGVSPTTIKRWASHFQNRFSKDENGHYVFPESDMEKLAFIKQQLEKRYSLSQIVLEDKPAADSVPASPVPSVSPADICAELSKRLDQLEHKLSQKAEDVVSVQLLEHRKELDELTVSVKQLLQSMETIKRTFAQLQKQTDSFTTASGYSKPPEPKKRRLLASLFQL